MHGQGVACSKTKWLTRAVNFLRIGVKAMTAIYAMWNKGGFTLAADSNQTISEAGQVWIDPIKKIFALDGHQVAFGAAGSSDVDGIDVNEIISRWQLTLTEPLATLEDYVSNFLNWFYEQDMPDYTHENLNERLAADFKIYKDLMDESLPDYKEKDFDTVYEFIVDQFAERPFEGLNAYGKRIERVESNRFTVDDNWLTAYKYEVGLKILNDVRTHVLASPKNDAYDNYIRGRIENELEDIIQKIFECDYDPESIWQQAIIEAQILAFENYAPTDNGHASCLFIGYGEDDWMPKAVRINMYDSEYTLRQVSIVTATSPKYDWYVALGINSGSFEITNGYSNDLLGDIEAFVTANQSEDDWDALRNEIRAKAKDRAQGNLKRIDFLTTQRLEFVARLFVELEALKSYLSSPLPGVGGDVQVITMTKTTRKERLYPEYLN